MMAKISVKGKDIAPLYQWLTHKSENGVSDAKIGWNFHKDVYKRQVLLLPAMNGGPVEAMLRYTIRLRFPFPVLSSVTIILPFVSTLARAMAARGLSLIHIWHPVPPRKIR